MPRKTKLTREALALIRTAGLDGDAYPSRAVLASAAGVSPQTFSNWLSRGEDAVSGVHRELADLVSEIDEFWVSVAEAAVFDAAFRPFEEFSIEGTVLDEQTGAPLKVRLRLLPPSSGLAQKWLAARRPEVWSERKSLELSGSVDAPATTKVVFVDIYPGDDDLDESSAPPGAGDDPEHAE